MSIRRWMRKMVASREDNNSVKSEPAIRPILLLVFSIGMCFLFWPQYVLFLRPIHSHADVIKLFPRSVEYKFYVPSLDKTLFFSRNLQLHESMRLQGAKQLDIIYPEPYPEDVYITLIQKPLPVWFYLCLHIACIFSLLISAKSFLEQFSG